MTPEMWVVGAVRVAGALPVLRWPLAGTLLALAVDLSDLALMNALDMGGLGDYQHFDKLADLAYMVTFLMASRRFPPLERRVATWLFALRLVGLAAFTATGARPALAAFPNLFEAWFVLVVARDRFAPNYALTRRRSAGWLVALLAAKLGQEYLLHVDRRLDQYNLLEVVRAARRWLETR